jgi:hypothetical protein
VTVVAGQPEVRARSGAGGGGGGGGGGGVRKRGSPGSAGSAETRHLRRSHKSPAWAPPANNSPTRAGRSRRGRTAADDYPLLNVARERRLENAAPRDRRPERWCAERP